MDEQEQKKKTEKSCFTASLLRKEARIISQPELRRFLSRFSGGAHSEQRYPHYVVRSLEAKQLCESRLNLDYSSLRLFLALLLLLAASFHGTCRGTQLPDTLSITSYSLAMGSGSIAIGSDGLRRFNTFLRRALSILKLRHDGAIENIKAVEVDTRAGFEFNALQ